MRIGELSARTGASRRSLRCYEEQGLLVSSRSPTGQRHYEDEHVHRVRLIQAFPAAGVPSSTIAEMAPWRVGRGRPDSQAGVGPNCRRGAARSTSRGRA